MHRALFVNGERWEVQYVEDDKDGIKVQVG